MTWNKQLFAYSCFIALVVQQSNTDVIAIFAGTESLDRRPQTCGVVTGDRIACTTPVKLCGPEDLCKFDVVLPFLYTGPDVFKARHQYRSGPHHLQRWEVAQSLGVQGCCCSPASS